VLLPRVGLHLPVSHHQPHRPGVVAVGLGLGVDLLDVASDALLLFLQALDALDEQPQLIRGDVGVPCFNQGRIVFATKTSAGCSAIRVL
jgi:hypothetical protein